MVTSAPPLVPLRWAEGRYGNHYAAVGKISRTVASVNYSMVRADPEPYIVTVSLPGVDRERRSAKTLDEAKAIAAAMVNRWLRDALMAPSQQPAHNEVPG